MMLLDYDDSSTSSTVATLIQPKKSAMTCMEKAADSRVRKSVRFNECANELFDNTQICSEDCAELWYRGEEYVSFKATAKFMASQIAQYDQQDENSEANDRFSYQRILLRTHEACRQCSTQQDDSIVFSSNSVLTQVEDKHLRRWMQGAPMRLGLERYAIRDLGRDRYNRRKNLVYTILHLQNDWIIHNIPITLEEQAECLSLASQAISRPSQLFSRHLAQAQVISF